MCCHLVSVRVSQLPHYQGGDDHMGGTLPEESRKGKENLRDVDDQSRGANVSITGIGDGEKMTLERKKYQTKSLGEFSPELKI